jgi:phenylacetate-CoA ligase
LKGKDLILREICPTLKVCIVTSEMLFDGDKYLMQAVFGIPVVNEYGASELDLIAFQNLRGEWQLNSDTLYVEIVDEHDMVLPYGEEGRVVITSLFNKAHPFIRYDIGDIGVMDESSTMVKPVLKQLIGRSNDLVRLPSGNTAAGLTFYYVTKSIIENDGNVKEFVIEQTELDSFLIKYISSEELEEHYKSKICSEIIKYLEPGLHINLKENIK